MNRDVRNRMKRTSRALFCSVMQALTEYRSAVDSMKTDEEEKLDRLPAAIRDSVKGDDIREGIELFDNVLDGTARIADALEDLVSGTLDYSFSYEPIFKAHEATPAGRQKRDTRFLSLMPREIMDRLKLCSSMTGLSMNELLVRALDSYLSSL